MMRADQIKTGDKPFKFSISDGREEFLFLCFTGTLAVGSHKAGGGTRGRVFGFSTDTQKAQRETERLH